MHKSLESGVLLLSVYVAIACSSQANDLFTGAGGKGVDGGADGGASGSGGSSGDGGNGAVAGSAAGGGAGDTGNEDASSGGTSGDAGTTDTGAGDALSDTNAGGSGGVGGCSNPATYYADTDKDGHGDPAVAFRSCSPPEGYVTSPDDCYDGNKQANPNQTGWFTVERGDGSFDYDCDGDGTPRFGEIGRCQSLAICMATPGWQTAVAPCGEEKAWITDCSFPLCVPPITEPRTQECH